MLHEHLKNVIIFRFGGEFFGFDEIGGVEQSNQRAARFAILSRYMYWIAFSNFDLLTTKLKRNYSVSNSGKYQNLVK